MIRSCLLAALAVAAAVAQIAPPPPTGMGASKTPTAPASQPVRKAPAAPPTPAAAPAIRDLKLPNLRPVKLPNPTEVTLSNGMRLLLLEDHSVPMVQGAVMVRTGSVFDPPDRVGLAAITGQVLRTGGTKTRTGDEVSDQLDNVAGTIESSVGETFGSVTFSAVKDRTGEVLSLFADVLTAPEFRQEDIDGAKQQFRAAIARRNDDPLRLVQREFKSALFGAGSPYGRREENPQIDRITRADLQNFYRRYYFPNNMILGVYGDFQSAAVQQQLDQLFAGWKPQQEAVPAFPAARPPQSGGTFLAAKSDARQTYFAIGQLSSEVRDPEEPALELIAEILANGPQSRLSHILAVGGAASAISSGNNAGYSRPGLFEITGTLKPFTTTRSIQLVRDEVARIRTSEVTDDELKTAKDSLLARLALSLDSLSKQMQRVLVLEYYGLPRDFLDQFQKSLLAVTRADVLRIAQARLDPARLTVVAAGNPVTFQEPLDKLGSAPVPIDLTILPPGKPTAPIIAVETHQMGVDILARAQMAAGGAGKLAAIKDYTQEATYQFTAQAGGMLVPETVRWIGPDLFRQDSAVPAGKISAYIDGNGGWIATPQGSGALVGPQLKQVQGDLFRLFFQMLLSDRLPGRTVSALDDTTVEIAGDTGELVRVVFDSTTWLPRNVLYETVTATGNVSVTDTYGDYREVSGIKLPFRITITTGGAKYADVTVQSYQFNAGLKAGDLQKRP